MLYFRFVLYLSRDFSHFFFLHKNNLTPVPLQLNGYDCGIFVFRYAYALIKLRDLRFSYNDLGLTNSNSHAFLHSITHAEPFKFDQEHVDQLRHRIKLFIRELRILMKERCPTAREAAELKQLESTAREATELQKTKDNQCNIQATQSSDEDSDHSHDSPDSNGDPTTHEHLLPGDIIGYYFGEPLKYRIAMVASTNIHQEHPVRVWKSYDMLGWDHKIIRLSTKKDGEVVHLNNKYLRLIDWYQFDTKYLLDNHLAWEESLTSKHAELKKWIDNTVADAIVAVNAKEKKAGDNKKLERIHKTNQMDTEVEAEDSGQDTHRDDQDDYSVLEIPDKEIRTCKVPFELEDKDQLSQHQNILQVPTDTATVVSQS